MYILSYTYVYPRHVFSSDGSGPFQWRKLWCNKDMSLRGNATYLIPYVLSCEPVTYKQVKFRSVKLSYNIN